MGLKLFPKFRGNGPYDKAIPDKKHQRGEELADKKAASVQTFTKATAANPPRVQRVPRDAGH